MRVSIDCEFLGLGETLAQFLPAGVEPTSVRVAQDSLRIEGRGPFGVGVALTGKVAHEQGGLRVSEIDLEGPAMLRAMALPSLRSHLASLDARNGPFRARGEEGGSAVRVSW